MNNFYIDITNDMLKNLNILFGGRGIGKTFSILKHRIEDSYEDPDEMHKFIWLRDTGEVVKKIAAGNSLAAPIKRVYPEFPEVSIVKNGSNFEFIANPNSDNYKILGYLMALSTFHNARGLSYEDVVDITWDEFIPEEGTVVKKNQGIIYLNMYESVNRNRELEGSAPVRMTFLSNTNDIYSDVLEDLGVSQIIEKMSINNESKYINDDIWIEFLESEPFTEAKAQTLLYRLANNYKFKEMALNNNFSNSFALIRPNVNLKNAKGLLTLSQKYTLVQLSDGHLYYKLGVWKNLINYDMENDQEALLYRHMFFQKLRKHYINGNIFFDSIYTQKQIVIWSKP